MVYAFGNRGEKASRSLRFQATAGAATMSCKRMRQNSRRYTVRARATEFVLPPIDDGLVLGRDSPIGHVAVGRALSLLTVTPFEHVEVDDDVIGDVLVRSAILRKITPAQLRKFVLESIKPIMGPEEIIQLNIEIEVTLDQEG